MMKESIMLYYKTMKELAEEIASNPVSDGKIVLREMDWKLFPDGFPDLQIPDALTLTSKRVILLLSFFDPCSLFSQISRSCIFPPHFHQPITLYFLEQSCLLCQDFQFVHYL